MMRNKLFLQVESWLSNVSLRTRLFIVASCLVLSAVIYFELLLSGDSSISAIFPVIPITIASFFFGLLGGLVTSLLAITLHILFHIPNAENILELLQHQEWSFLFLMVDGVVIGLLGEARQQYTKDINARKQMETALRQSEQLAQELSATAQRQARELSLLDQVRTALARELDMALILRSVVEAIARTFEYQLVSIYLIEGDYLVLQHQVGYQQVLAQIPLGKGVISRSIETRQPVLLQDVHSDPDFLGVIDGVGSEIAVPLFLRGEAIGALNVESTSGFTLGENDLNLLIALSKDIHIAFERARLYTEVCESEERFRTSIDTFLDGFAIFSAIRDAAGQVIDFRCEYINDAGCQLNRRTREEQVGNTVLNLLSEHKDAGLIDDFTRVVETGQPLHKDTFLNMPGYGTGEKLARVLDLRAVKLGDGFALAWRDVTDRVQMEMAEHEQRILAEALVDTAAALISTPHLEEVLSNILANVGKVVPHESANIMLVEDGVARIVDYRGDHALINEAAAKSLRYIVTEVPNFSAMMVSGRPMVIPFTNSDHFWMNIPGTHWIQSYAGAPIQVQGQTIGFINLNSSTPGFFNEAHAERLQAFANQVAIAVENARLYAQSQQLAITDELTGVFNRRGLFELGQREVERAKRMGHPLSALILDIDHFKIINDTYGHMVGDLVLKNLVKRCRSNIREVDILGRYGGEEFVILFPELDLSQAFNIAERLRERISDELFQISRTEVQITVSLGTATIDGQNEDLAALIEKADQALYFAKQSGRNRVAMATTRTEIKV